MTGSKMLRPRLYSALGGAALMLLGSAHAWAQPAGSVGTTPVEANQQKANRILAVGNLTSKATRASLPQVLEREVPATLELYLNGKIEAWYAKPDQTGVVFILNVATVEEAHALLDPLPLGQAGMMTFELTPIGPLQPLGLLLRQTTK